MIQRLHKITSLPTRYEPLVNLFGEKAQATFVAQQSDIDSIKRFIVSAESSRQGKFIFIHAESGSGKSTFIHGLEIFMSDKIDRVVRLPLPHELGISDVPRFVAELPHFQKYTIINFDGRESPYFNEAEYQSSLGAINSILRNRPDVLVFWPVNDIVFAKKIVELLQRSGGSSVFGPSPIHSLVGLSNDQYLVALEKIMQVANWSLEDAAISATEVDDLVQSSSRIGLFLDNLHQLIVSRFNIDSIGVNLPTVVIAISSGEPKIREVCRSLRRADSFYIEASRLLMYTKKSNVAEWWLARSDDIKSALPHVIALFNAQLVSISASAVIHSILQYGAGELRNFIHGVRPDRGNARKVIASSELFKYLVGTPTDNREYGSNVKEETFSSYDQIQKHSETKHRAINEAVLKMAENSGANLPGLAFETNIVSGLQTDVVYSGEGGVVAIELHHKSTRESTQNKLAIYILEKLKEYTINFGLSSR